MASVVVVGISPPVPAHGSSAQQQSSIKPSAGGAERKPPSILSLTPVAAIQGSSAGILPTGGLTAVTMTTSGMSTSVKGTPVTLPRSAARRRGRSNAPGGACGSHQGNSNLPTGTPSRSFVRACQKAKRVRFFRNGDQYFKGVWYAISAERFRSLEALMEDLTRSLDDLKALPHGVRVIFTLDGSDKVMTLEDLFDGESYVCASWDSYKRIDYLNAREPLWSYGTKFEAPRPESSNSSASGELTSSGTGLPSNDFVYPKIITVIKNGVKPRRVIRLLLNKRTAHTFEQVLADITMTIRLDSGAVKRLFTIRGDQVASLADFFKEDDIFIAYGSERLCLDDFYLGHEDSSSTCENNRPSPILRRRFIDQRNQKHIKPRQKVNFVSVKPSISKTKKANKKPKNGLKCKVAPGAHPGRGTTKPTSNGAGSPPEDPRPSSQTPTGDEMCSASTPTLPSIPPDPKGSSKHSTHSPEMREELSEDADRMQVSTTSSSGYPMDQEPPEEDGIILDEGVEEHPQHIEERYRIGRVIGDGNFALVYESFDRNLNQTVALKVIDKEKVGKREMVESEVELMRSLRHPHIVQLFADHETPDKHYLALEIITGGDLFDSLVSARYFSECEAAQLHQNLISALAYLHSINVVHRDVKPENLLVFERENRKHLKLADFGLATTLKPDEALFTVCGTPTYVAPEILTETGYGEKVDIWAAGVILYIMLCGFPPFVSLSNDQEELFDLIVSGQYSFPKPYWDCVSSASKGLIQGMLQLEADDRYSAEEVLIHPWITGEGRFGESTTSPESYDSSQFSDFAQHAEFYSTRRRSMDELSQATTGGGNYTEHELDEQLLPEDEQEPPGSSRAHDPPRQPSSLCGGFHRDEGSAAQAEEDAQLADFIANEALMESFHGGHEGDDDDADQSEHAPATIG